MTENYNKRVYVCVGLEPRENTFFITSQECKVDLDFHCNHVDTVLVFHV